MVELIIDRFEGDYAVVELADGSKYDLPRILLPPNSHEGDVVVIKVDQVLTAKRRQDTAKLMKELWDD